VSGVVNSARKANLLNDPAFLQLQRDAAARLRDTLQKHKRRQDTKRQRKFVATDKGKELHAAHQREYAATDAGKENHAANQRKYAATDGGKVHHAAHQRKYATTDAGKASVAPHTGTCL